MFVLGEIKDLKSIYQLMNDRMDWMKEKGIKQWAHEHYWSIYPKSYYQTMVENHQLYVYKNEVGEVVGSIVLYESDERWQDQKNAYYLHQLVTSLRVKGIGVEILSEVEKLAKKQGKEVLRLDCIADNSYLNRYYENLGFHLVGECFEGIYHGHLRENKM